MSKLIIEFTEKELSLLKKLAGEDKTVTEIAKELNRPISSIRNKLNSLDIVYKKRKYVRQHE